ncbi:MAG: T9SS type A sorting domain-containing protein [Ignavibacteria bacterium]|nr:T9SS type A sorting domain-containing protein [Ignavibacteria bacterium]
MKNFIITLVILFLFSESLYSQPAWTPIVSNLRYNVSICFPSSSTGYYTNTRNSLNSTSYLFKTTNGGATWDSTKFTSYINVFFLNSLTGFMGLKYAKTTDGGITWDSTLRPSLPKSATKFFFLNDTLGFFVNYTTGSEQRQILKTTNAGASWAVILQGYHTDSCGFPYVYFINENTGFVNNVWFGYTHPPDGEPTLTTVKAELLKTTNSGTNWFKITNPPAFTSNPNTVTPFKFFNANTGFGLSVKGTYQYILKTSNGGITWDSVNRLPSSEYIRDIKFIDTNNAYAFGSFVYKTSDGFKTYTKQMIASQFNDRLYLGGYFDNDAAYIYNYGNGNIYKTSGITVYPVELSSFTSSVNKRNVTLNWSTVNEENNSGFAIERKNSSSDEWSKIGNVRGVGTTNSPIDYSYSDKNLSTGKYNYRLKQVDFNGNFKYYDLTNEVIIGTPEKFDLLQNYPNPFNPSTKINYDLPFESKVQIKIFDMTGREVAQIVNETKTAGYYTAQFNASAMASGVYFYTISANGGNRSFVKTMKMALVK